MTMQRQIHARRVVSLGIQPRHDGLHKGIGLSRLGPCNGRKSQNRVVVGEDIVLQPRLGGQIRDLAELLLVERQL